MIFNTKIHQEMEVAFEKYNAEAYKIECGRHTALIRARKALSELINLAKKRRAELLEDYNLEFK